MKARFAFDANAWSIVHARRAVAAIASLLELPYRITAPGDAAEADDVLVHVGDPGAAPREAVTTIAVEGWPAWDAATLERRVVAGEGLPCPPVTPESLDTGAHFPAAWLRAAAFTLAREEELQDRRRDLWECYSGTFTRLGPIGLLERPFINDMAATLERRLRAHAESLHRSFPSVPRWPKGARFAVALTHDVDDVTLRSFTMALRLLRQAHGPRSYAFRAGLTGLGRALLRPPGATDPYWAFDRWMGEEERRGFRSTFYVCPPAPAPRHEYDALYTMRDTLGYEGRRITVAALLGEMRRRGHEVGLHGSYLSHVSGEELARQRADVAAGAGGPVTGIRQHFLRFEAGATWRAQAAAGFDYDTTLGYNERLGFRAGIAAPYRPWDAETGMPYGPLELPLTVMDGTLFRTHRLDVPTAVSKLEQHFDTLEAAGGLGVLLWHPNVAHEAAFPGWWRTYLAALDELTHRAAWVAPAGEIAQWWAERELRLAALRAA